MKVSSKILYFISLLLLFGCKKEESSKAIIAHDSAVHTNHTVIQPEDNAEFHSDSTIDECVITNEGQELRGELFPFKFQGFSIAKIRRHFSGSVILDSINHRNEDVNYTIYTFKQGTSYLSFFVKPQTGNETWFYLEESTIENNLFNFKNGVRIGMPRKEVYKAFGLTQNTCDTLHFQEGDLFTYYDFIFRDDILAKINITPEH